MQISHDRYFHDLQRHDLALRMIKHEARTCTIRHCTGLTEDRIRRLHKTLTDLPVRVKRRRGRSPRQIGFFTRSAQMQFESSFLASVFTAFGLTPLEGEAPRNMASVESGELFCDAYETHRQLLGRSAVSFEHAWFLLQLLARQNELKMTRCRRCQSHYLLDLFNLAQRACPICELKSEPSPRTLSRHRSLAKRLPVSTDLSKEVPHPG
jgi:hypothetical protein